MVDFLDMGGYGLYVWSAYGLAFLLLGLVFWQSLRALRVSQSQLNHYRLRRGQTRVSNSAPSDIKPAADKDLTSMTPPTAANKPRIKQKEMPNDKP